MPTQSVFANAPTSKVEITKTLFVQPTPTRTSQQQISKNPLPFAIIDWISTLTQGPTWFPIGGSYQHLIRPISTVSLSGGSSHTQEASHKTSG
ncbi:hypothetical protein CEXT_440271 [Caerostris extrusa]|uniref:Uncharacterized protein n=1 Tax=Caerostris extrusa TaxID=172846 RepID=A0AAV4PVX8_CAEEX|nr:hypothetical protein CEXT_440271 [Caerostris extrusa]